MGMINFQYSDTLDIMMSAASLLSVSLIIGQAWSARDLFSVRSPLTRSLEPCCDHTHVLSCVDVEVDPEVLLNDHDISINNVTLAFSNFIPPHARTYKTAAGDEAIISYNPKTGRITGTLHTEDGRGFALEKCGDSYIFEEFDEDNFPGDEVEDEDDADDRVFDDNININATENMRQGQKTYSIMFYYTPEFAAVTPNIEDFIDQAMATLNQGYANSKIPITATKFCSELSTISEEEVGNAKRLGSFRKSKGHSIEGYDALRNTADVAVLLVKGYNMCGTAYQHSALNKRRPFSVVKKTCAIGGYTLGHEIGHNFGCAHDIKRSYNNKYPFGHGYQILEPGFTDKGYLSIMSYGKGLKKPKKVNYYSNPDVILPNTGTPTGLEGVADNRAVFMESIDKISALGDESGSCSSS